MIGFQNEFHSPCDSFYRLHLSYRIDDGTVRSCKITWSFLMTVFCIFKCFKVPLPLVCNRLWNIMGLEWWYCFGGLGARSSFTLSTGLLWQWGIANSSGLENVVFIFFFLFVFLSGALGGFSRCRVVRSRKIGDGLSRMCFGQVGNCDIGNACERVGFSVFWRDSDSAAWWNSVKRCLLPTTRSCF